MTKRRTTPRLPLDEYNFPWMPVYADELHALAGVLGNELMGGFLRLRAYAWRQKPRCTVPDDEIVLARVSGFGQDWPRVREAVMELLHPIEGGRLRDVALTLKFIEQALRFDTSQARATAGRSGGVRSGEARREHRAEQRGSNGNPVHGPPLNLLTTTTTATTNPPLDGQGSGSEGAVDISDTGQATGEAPGRVDLAAMPEWQEMRRLLKPGDADREVGSTDLIAPPSPPTPGVAHAPHLPEQPAQATPQPPAVDRTPASDD